MNHYKPSLILAARPEEVYAALTTAEGLQSWWTEDCDVTGKVGDIIHFRFGPHHKHMRIERLERSRAVSWQCVEAHIQVEQLRRKDESIGTQILFRLTPQGDGTRLEFEHIGLMPSLECYEMCDKGWRYFLASLQQFSNTGHGTPYQLEIASAT